MLEIWKEVAGTDGAYLVSNMGNVISTNYKGKEGPHLLAPVSSKGYLSVRICKKMRSIHRLVAEAFVPNPHGYDVVNHLDENPSNNRADNLEWCTFIHNCNYGTRNERISKTMMNNKYTSKKVLYTNNEGLSTVFLSTADAGRKLGISQSVVCECCRGNQKTCKLGKFEYYTEGAKV